MPVCEKCRIAYLDGEQHVCEVVAWSPGRIAASLLASVGAVLLPLPLQLLLGYLPNGHPFPPVLGLVLWLLPIVLGSLILWRAWANQLLVAVYVVVMLPASLSLGVWLSVRYLGGDWP